VLMPEMDGIAATKHIRQHLAIPLCNIPILGLTANAYEDTRQQCISAGMNDVVYKPFKREDLVEKILELCE
jgi:two-component system, sensor histidine kinase